jgi:hypothetical protein
MTSVTLDGELVCLPHRAGRQEALTQACAVGLRTPAGRLYALGDINADLMQGNVAVGQPVQVSGHLRAEMDQRYEALGTIEVTAVRRRAQP